MVVWKKIFLVLFSLLIVLTTFSVLVQAAATTETPSITPNPAYTVDDLEGFCDVTSSQSLVNYYYEWFRNGVSYSSGDTVSCYQETATTSTSCGGVSSGVYSQTPGFINVNYTKPLIAEGASWVVKHGDLATYSVNIPAGCWNAYANVLSLRMVARDSGSYLESYGQCFDGSNWVNITSVESVNSISATSTADNYDLSFDEDYSTGIWYYSLLSDWGVCTGGDCSKAMFYEEGVDWVFEPHVNANNPYSVGDIFSVNTVFNDDWVLSCKAVDSTGPGVWVNSSVTNILYDSTTPLMNGVVIKNSPYMVYDDLHGWCNATDSDDPEVFYDYEWYSDLGLVAQGVTGNNLQGVSFEVDVLDDSYLTTGGNWTLSCRASDGVNVGSWLNSSTIAIRNNILPVITNVEVTPDPIVSSNDATCSWTYFDGDGDVQNNSLVEWRVNGYLVLSEQTNVSSSILGSVFYSRGDVIKCSVTGSDGYSNSANAVEDSLTVSNSVPTFTSVLLAQDPSFKGDALTCSLSGVDDLDGDSLTFYYEFLDSDYSTVLQASSTSNVFDCSTNSYCNKGDSIMCVGLVSDSYDNSTPKNDTASIINSAPTATNVYITPYAPQDSQDLVCESTYNDVDGDVLSSTSYRWFKNGLLTAYNTNVVSNFNTASGDDWVCEVTYNDGFVDSAPVNTSIVTIDDNDPYVIVLSNDGEVDEGDNITFTWTWYNAGLTGDITHYLCDTSNIGVNGCLDNTLCEVNSTSSPVSCSYEPPSIWSHQNTAYLAMVDDLGVMSTVATNNWLLNHRPTVGSLSLNVTATNGYNYYDCELTGITDVDGDSTTGNSVYYFYDDNSNLLQVGGTNTYIVSQGYGTGEEPVECRAQANDGRIYSAFLANSDYPRVQSLVMDSYVDLNDLTTLSVRLYNTSAVNGVNLTYLTSLNFQSTDNAMTYNSATGYYDLSLNPNSVGIWRLKNVFFSQTDGQSYLFQGDGDNFEVIDSVSGGGAGGSGGSSNTTIVINNTLPYCGDGICSLDENPTDCWKDCQINYDSLVTCLWDDNVECNWEQNWFAIALISFLIIVALWYIANKENNKKNLSKKKRQRYKR